MFANKVHYLPTLREIRDELIEAQLQQIQQKAKHTYSSKTNFTYLKDTYKDRWQMLFDLASLGDLDKPLTSRILKDPQHKITCHLLYLYSMESFIYEEINKACRLQDKSKIEYYGAYSAALSFILNSNSESQTAKKWCGKSRDKTILLYRGFRMTEEKILE